jgi:hypothetical protein
VPVATASTAAAQTHTAGATLITAGASSSSSSSSSGEGIAGVQNSSALMVDIGCLVPAQLLQTIEQQGLVQTLQAMRSHSCSSSSSSNAAGLSATRMHLEQHELQQQLLAVEVDGPSHVAVNCWGHRLGSTVSRSWLLQQQGWAVLEVPWWQWEEGGL